MDGLCAENRKHSRNKGTLVHGRPNGGYRTHNAPASAGHRDRSVDSELLAPERLQHQHHAYTEVEHRVNIGSDN